MDTVIHQQIVIPISKAGVQKKKEKAGAHQLSSQDETADTSTSPSNDKHKELVIKSLRMQFQSESYCNKFEILA